MLFILNMKLANLVVHIDYTNDDEIYEVVSQVADKISNWFVSWHDWNDTTWYAFTLNKNV